MLIAGDLSGIQDYVLGVAHEGGGQARRLRARSFYVQALAEAALVRILDSTGWSQVHFCAAGKFVLEGLELEDESLISLKQQGIEINEWLLKQTGGKLRFSLVWHDATEAPYENYSILLELLKKQKLTSWSDVAIQNKRWDPLKLIDSPLDTPCAICQNSHAEFQEIDPDGSDRQVCYRCHQDSSLGRTLPKAHWMLIQNKTSSYNVLGLGLDFQESKTLRGGEKPLAIANLMNPNQTLPPLSGTPFHITRHLAAHVPKHHDGQLVEFQELAKKAQGDQLLGVIKADGDRMGEYFDRIFKEKGWKGLSQGSKAIDHFFAGTLKLEMSALNSRWNYLYTIFSGGDDLLLVGPWDLTLDFVAHIRQLFDTQFKGETLTFSVGIAFIKPNRPIKFAADQADRLLDEAKDAGRNRVAALGQVWTWDAHDQILTSARTLVQWTKQGVIERSWLHTLLDLVLLRLDPSKPTTERLCASFKAAYHVSRNWPSRRNNDPLKNKARCWADDIVNHFDQLDQAVDIQFKYLQVILRYALMATRKGTEQ